MTRLDDMNAINSNLRGTLDRGEFYISTFNLTGSPAALLEGHISMFSGSAGGIAFAANYLLADQATNGVEGIGMPYTFSDIYILSQQVAQGLGTAVLQDIENAGTGSLSITQGINAARGSWTNFRAGLQEYFPGNEMAESFWGIFPNPFNNGPSDDLVEQANYGSFLFGKSISDFSGLAGYTTRSFMTQANQVDYVIKGTSDTNDDGVIDYHDGKVIAVGNSRWDYVNNANELYAEALDWPSNWETIREWDLLKEFRQQLTEGGYIDFEQYFEDKFSEDKRDFWGQLEERYDEDAKIRNEFYYYDRAKSGDHKENFLYGGKGNDSLSGGGGDDLLNGGWGNDELDGGEDNDEIYGDKGNDTIYGSAGEDVIDGGAGYDTLDYSALDERVYVNVEGGQTVTNVEKVIGAANHHNILSWSEGIQELHGGSQSDSLTGGEGEDVLLYGGGGQDIFNLAAGTFVMDAEDGGAAHGDFITWGPYLLSGGVRQSWDETGWARESTASGAIPPNIFNFNTLPVIGLMEGFAEVPDIRFGATTSGQMLVQLGRGRVGQAVIEDYELDLDSGNGSGNVVAYELVDTPSSIADYRTLVKLAFAQAGFDSTGIDPLVVDLDGDGIELTSLTRGTYFDFDGDGFAERAGWVKADDALVVRDKNGNGEIDNIKELFGNENRSGFAQLRRFDTNDNNVLTAKEANKAGIKLWQDADGDAQVDAGELMSFGKAGVSRISLKAKTTDVEIKGNVQASKATVVKTDGSKTTAGDIHFDVNQVDSQYLGKSAVSAKAAALPNLKGYGDMPDLDIQMTSDKGLLNLVKKFDAKNDTLNWNQYEKMAAGVLLRWAEVKDVPKVALGNKFDTQKLAFLEKYFGNELAPRDTNGNPLEDSVGALKESWNAVLDNTTLRLTAQGPLKEVLKSFRFDVDSDEIIAKSPTALTAMFKRIMERLPEDTDKAELAFARQWKPLVEALKENALRDDRMTIKDDYIVQHLLRANAASDSPLSLRQSIDALKIKGVKLGDETKNVLEHNDNQDLNIFVGGGGNDKLIGGVGQDVYVFGKGFGKDTIKDVVDDVSGDRIRFAYHKSDQIAFESKGLDLILKVDGAKDQILVKNYFKTPSYSLTKKASPLIEEIQFADGEVMDTAEVAARLGLGTNGRDTLIGSMMSDEIEGLKGNDLLKGGDSGDTYYYTVGDGNDVIRDIRTNDQFTSPDTLIMLNTFSDKEVRFDREGDSPDLQVLFGNGQSVTIKDQFDYTPVGFQVSGDLDSRIESFFHESGIGYGWLDVQQKIIERYTTDENDITYGFGTSDQFASSAGNDLLIGKDGGDIYHFERGSGNDTIYDQSEVPETFISGILGYSWGSDDELHFGADIRPGDVEFIRDSEAPDLLIQLKNSEDSVLIKNQFDGVKLDLFDSLGVAWFDRVEKFIFDNGATLTWENVLKKVTRDSDGDSKLYGALYPDTLKGGKGDDYLSGGDDGDTYIFRLGDGHDIIDDQMTNVLVTAKDTLRFVGINRDEVKLSHLPQSDDLKIEVIGGNDSVLIRGQYDIAETGVFGAHGFNQIERFVWGDGEVSSWAQLQKQILNQEQTSHDDYIEGGHFNDRFISGKGDDTMSGSDGSDHYYFGRGSGHDVIHDNLTSIFSENNDVVHFGENIAPDDLRFKLTGHENSDLRISIRGTDDSLTIRGHAQTSVINTKEYPVERFHFNNGEKWSAEQLQKYVLNQATSSKKDIIVGFDTNDRLEGGKGNDILIGMDGNDNYVFKENFGRDEIRETVTYINYGSTDRVVFGKGITKDQLEAYSFNDSIVLALKDTNDSVFIRTIYDTESIETIKFSDGTKLGEKAIEKLIENNFTRTFNGNKGANQLAGKSSDDKLYGKAGNDTITGGKGDDYIHAGSGNDVIKFNLGHGHDTISGGGGNDTLRFGNKITKDNITIYHDGDDLLLLLNDNSSVGIQDNSIERFLFSDGTKLSVSQMRELALQKASTSRDDIIEGFSGNDVLKGGKGDDILYGGKDGYDRYIINREDGHDTIQGGGWGKDIVSFGKGITWEKLQASQDFVTEEIVINLPGNNSLTLDDTIAYGHNSFQFADGSKYSFNDLKTLILDQATTSRNDMIKGFDSADTIVGGKGNDVMYGEDGADKFIINKNQGTDFIDGGWGSDILKFGKGITWSNIKASHANEGGIHIDLPGNGAVTVERIEKLHFANGDKYSLANLRELVVDQASTNGNDVIVGFKQNDTIVGGKGNDRIEGGWGRDVFIIKRGDGHDTIDGSLDVDTIKFGKGLEWDDFYLTEDTEGNVVLNLSEEQSITLINGFNTDRGVDKFRLFDGDVKSIKDLKQLKNLDKAHVVDEVLHGNKNANLLVGDGGQDTLYGYEGNDSLHGGDGNDFISGGTQKDTVSAGNGNDTVYGDNGRDLIRLNDGDDLFYDNEQSGRNGADIVYGGDGNDTIQGMGGNDSLYGGQGKDLIEGGDDGDLIRGGSDNDTIRSGEGHDTVYGDEGRDKVYLGAGNDVFHDHAQNNTHGHDYIHGGGGNDTINGAGGNDTMIGAGGTDLLKGGSGNDLLKGDNGRDRLFGGDGKDTMHGGDGNDLLKGGAHHDRLFGSSGNDTIYGDNGNDLLKGGTGHDQFFFNKGFGRDTIADFGRGNDVLIFKDISAYSSKQDVLDAAHENGGNTIITLNTSHSITLENFTGLDASDIVII